MWSRRVVSASAPTKNLRSSPLEEALPAAAAPLEPRLLPLEATPARAGDGLFLPIPESTPTVLGGARRQVWANPRRFRSASLTEGNSKGRSSPAYPNRAVECPISTTSVEIFSARPGTPPRARSSRSATARTRAHTISITLAGQGAHRGRTSAVEHGAGWRRVERPGGHWPRGPLMPQPRDLRASDPQAPRSLPQTAAPPHLGM